MRREVAFNSIARWDSCRASMQAKVEHPFRVIKRQLATLGALPWPGQERCAGADAICVVQPVDDPPAVRAGPGINPSGGAQGASENSNFIEIHSSKRLCDALAS